MDFLGGTKSSSKHSGMDDRLIGRKSILPVIEIMYDIHTWPGAIKFIRAHNLPLRRTPSGRPMFLKSELIGYDVRFQAILCSLL